MSKLRKDQSLKVKNILQLMLTIAGIIPCVWLRMRTAGLDDTVNDHRESEHLRLKQSIGPRSHILKKSSTYSKDILNKYQRRHQKAPSLHLKRLRGRSLYKLYRTLWSRKKKLSSVWNREIIEINDTSSRSSIPTIAQTAPRFSSYNRQGAETPRQSQPFRDCLAFGEEVSFSVAICQT